MKCNVCGGASLKLAVDDVYDCCNAESGYNGRFYSCRNCGTAMVDPWLTANDLQEAYAGYYTHKKANLPKFFSVLKKYYRRTLHLEASHRYEEKIKNFILLRPLKFHLDRAINFLPAVKDASNFRILEVGCGNGKHLLRYQSIGLSAFGIDPDEHAISNLADSGLSASCQSVTSVASSSYDAVVMSHVIEHVDDPRVFMGHIFRILKKEGYLFISTPNFGSAGRKTFGASWRGLDFPRHKNIFCSKSFESFIEKSGFWISNDIFDFSQGIGILTSSFRIAKRSRFNLFIWLEIIKNGLFNRSSREVLVLRCFKREDN